jgi:hypothetical protein
MNDIIEKITNKAVNKLTKEIDDYALAVFNIPPWVLKRKYLLRLYVKFYGLVIEQQRNLSDLSTDYRFIKRNKKIGELKLRDIDFL